MEANKKEKQEEKEKVQKPKCQKPEKRAVDANVVCGCGCIAPFQSKK